MAVGLDRTLGRRTLVSRRDTVPPSPQKPDACCFGRANLTSDTPHGPAPPRPDRSVSSSSVAISDGRHGHDRSPQIATIAVPGGGFIGWIASRNHALLEQLRRHKHYTTNCNAGPSEHLATIALSVGQEIHARNRAIIAENLPVFDAFFEQWPDQFAWEKPQGGCVCFPRLVTGEPASSFCQRVTEHAGIVLFGADMFASELAEVPADRFRIGVGKRDPTRALQAIGSFLGQQAPPVLEPQSTSTA